MKEKFTPGPWETDIWGGACPERCKEWAFENMSVMSSDRSICMVQGDNDKPVKANARLIAAAPDMYEALKLAIAFLDDSDHSTGAERDALDMAKASLAKADGTL